jgi:hypothetical protein
VTPDGHATTIGKYAAAHPNEMVEWTMGNQKGQVPASFAAQYARVHNQAAQAQRQLQAKQQAPTPTAQQVQGTGTQVQVQGTAPTTPSATVQQAAQEVAAVDLRQLVMDTLPSEVQIGLNDLDVQLGANGKLKALFGQAMGHSAEMAKQYVAGQMLSPLAGILKRQEDQLATLTPTVEQQRATSIATQVMTANGIGGVDPRAVVQGVDAYLQGFVDNPDNKASARPMTVADLRGNQIFYSAALADVAREIAGRQQQSAEQVSPFSFAPAPARQPSAPFTSTQPFAYAPPFGFGGIPGASMASSTAAPNALESINQMEAQLRALSTSGRDVTGEYARQQHARRQAPAR